jgi:LacI family transcriptional regulator
MKDVARNAGLSLYTVSKVLNGHASVREGTRKKVLLACESLGYERNPHAVNLVSRKTTTIGMVVSSFTNSFYGEIIEAAEREARRRGYNIVYQCSYLDPAIEASILRHFQALRVCGMVIAPVVTSANRALLERAEEDFPVVYVDRYFSPDSSYVVNDNVESAGLATRHLIELGAEPAYLGSIRSGLNQALQDREVGYRQTMEAAGLSPRLIPAGHSTAERDNEQFGYENMKASLAAREAPRGLFCANDSVAIGAMRALEERGLKVGKDVLVVGHDNLSYTAYMNPPLTTVDQPKKQMGEGAVSLLLDLSADEERESPRQRVLHSRLCVRASTGGA